MYFNMTLNNYYIIVFEQILPYTYMVGFFFVLYINYIIIEINK